MSKKKPRHDIDDDPDFDISESAINNAIDRRLTQLFDRIDRLEEEKKGIADDIRDVYLEAKAVGYDTKIMRAIRKLRNMDKNDRAEMDALIETYRRASGI